jgi:hypothetical protein
MNFNNIRKYLASVRIIVEAIQLDFSAASPFFDPDTTRHRLCHVAALLLFQSNTYLLH